MPSLSAQWWTHWPGAEDVGDPTDPWLVNYRAHWGRPEGALAVRMTARNETHSTVLHVFAEYDRLCTRISEHRRLSQDERAARSWMPHDAPDGPVLISGTPGIGKSHFIYYFAVLLMRFKQPFIVYSGPPGKRCHLITPDGVRVAHADTLDDLSDMASLLQSAANVPFLFDRVSVKDTPSESFFLVALFFYVQAAGPDPEYFSWAKRSTRAREFVMNPPTGEEVVQVLRGIFPRDQKSDRELRRALEVHGPSISATRDALHAGQTRALSALTAAFTSGARTPADLLRLWHPALIKSVCPHPPTPEDKGWLGPDGVQHVLANATAMRLVLVHLQTGVRDMLDHLSFVPHTPSSARWLFEAWAHLVLCKLGGGRFVLRCFDAQSAEARTVTFPQLQSAPLGEATEAGKYYIPTSLYGTPFDAFVRLPDGAAYAFHMTLATAHTFDPAGLSMLPVCDSPDKNFVFVVPKGRAFSLSHPGCQWKFWVLELELDRSARDVIEGSYGYWDVHQRGEDP